MTTSPQRAAIQSYGLSPLVSPETDCFAVQKEDSWEPVLLTSSLKRFWHAGSRCNLLNKMNDLIKICSLTRNYWWEDDAISFRKFLFSQWSMKYELRQSVEVRRGMCGIWEERLKWPHGECTEQPIKEHVLTALYIIIPSFYIVYLFHLRKKKKKTGGLHLSQALFSLKMFTYFLKIKVLITIWWFSKCLPKNFRIPRFQKVPQHRRWGDLGSRN